MGTVNKSEIAINWIENNLIVPDGDYVGKKIQLADFQKEVLQDVFDNPHGTMKAIITMPRGAAKTTLCACILALFLIGPFVKQNTQLVSTALTKEQAGLTYDLLAKMLVMNHYLAKYVKIRDFKKQIVNPKLRITYTALSADAKDKQGGAAYVAVHDEVGSIRGPRSDLITAVDYGMKKNKGSISFYISTQAAGNNDFYSNLIDTYKDGGEPTAIVKIFACPEEVDPLSEEALEYHPAFNTFGDKEGLRALQREARLMPTKLVEFRQFFLNQRVDAEGAFINPAIWKVNGNQPEPWHGKDVYVSLDLSRVNDLTSMTILFKNDHDEKFSVVPFFYLPQDGIREKAKNDRVQWDVWANEGFITLTPGKIVGYEYVAKQLREIHEKANIVKFAFDRYNIFYFKKHLLDVGFNEHWIQEHQIDFGQGFKSMHPAILQLETMLIQEELAHGNHPVLTYCFDNVKVVVDPANWRKFDKKSKDRKIDGAITTVMCAGIYADFGKNKAKPKTYMHEEDLFII